MKNFPFQLDILFRINMGGHHAGQSKIKKILGTGKHIATNAYRISNVSSFALHYIPDEMFKTHQLILAYPLPLPSLTCAQHRQIRGRPLKITSALGEHRESMDASACRGQHVICYAVLKFMSDLLTVGNHVPGTQQNKRNAFFVIHFSTRGKCMENGPHFQIYIHISHRVCMILDPTMCRTAQPCICVCHSHNY